MTTISVTDARATLPELLDRVAEGAEVTITRHGAPVAVLVRPDNLRHRRVGDVFEQARHIHDLVENARNQPMPTTGLSDEFAEELIKEIRAGRDGE